VPAFSITLNNPCNPGNLYYIATTFQEILPKYGYGNPYPDKEYAAKGGFPIKIRILDGKSSGLLAALKGQRFRFQRNEKMGRKAEKMR